MVPRGPHHLLLLVHVVTLSSGTTLVPSQKHVHIGGSRANPTLFSDTIVLLHTEDENVIVLRTETNTD
jgi:hypothetical protein